MLAVPILMFRPPQSVLLAFWYLNCLLFLFLRSCSLASLYLLLLCWTVDINVCSLLADSQKSRQRGYSPSEEKDEASVTDDDVIVSIIGRHDEFFNSMQSRLDKLQVLRITFAPFCSEVGWVWILTKVCQAVF